MRLWQVLFSISIALLLTTITLVIQVRREQAWEVKAEFQYYETLADYNERILTHAIDLIDRQEIMIRYQRRLINRLGQSPCVEHAWLMLR